MLKSLKYGAQAKQVTAGFCTLAVHPPYRQRAKLLLSDAPGVPWIVLTDEPDDFGFLQGKMLRLGHDLLDGVRDQFAFLRQRTGGVAIEHESAQPSPGFHQALALEQLINLGDGEEIDFELVRGGVITGKVTDVREFV